MFAVFVHRRKEQQQFALDPSRPASAIYLVYNWKVYESEHGSSVKSVEGSGLRQRY
jgi:hypothetical protein